MDALDNTETDPGLGRRRGEELQRQPQPGQTLAGRFLLRRIIGYGATGTVFAALDTAVGQKVAIKLLHPHLHDERTRERLRREVRAARSGHPHLVAVFDLHEAEGRIFLSMELVEGQSLKERVSDCRPLALDEVVSIGRQVAAALAHLHAHGIVHRDVKPGNILLTADGTAKLCDMGLARPLDEGMTVTMTDTVVGTPAYMAPEQGLGAELTASADVYGLGVTLYQCLTGIVPLTSETAVATLTRRQRERPPAVRREHPACPRWLDRLLRRMLEPRPADRPGAATVVRALASRRLLLWPRRKTVAAVAVMVVLVAALFGAAPRLIHRRTVAVAHDHDAVFGLDARGRRTWSRRVPDPVVDIDRADLDGDAREEVIIATRRDTSIGEVRPGVETSSHVLVLSENGEEITELIPEDFVGEWEFPYRLDLVPSLEFMDLDGDGWIEIVVNCRHDGFYPAVLLVYWPRWDTWDDLLHHPGAVIAVGSATEFGSSGLRFIAYNNLLGMIKVYGEIELLPPGDRPPRRNRTTSLTAPPARMPRSSTAGSWRTYVPFAPGSATPYRDTRFIIEHRPEPVIGLADRGPTFDRFFNPIGGPNEGRDLRERRLAFAESLSLLGRNQPITANGTARVLERIRSDAGTLMLEEPYEIILTVLGAKALAGAGDRTSAINLLEKFRARVRDDDLLYRLSHLYALDGAFSHARATLLDTIDFGSTARSGFDVPLLLLQIAIRQRDAEGAEQAIGYLAERASDPTSLHDLRRNLEARVHLWWDEGTPIDADVRSVDLDGDGDAVACLIRWRLGATMPLDAVRMRRLIDLNPDSFKLGTVALAAALLAQGQPEAAISELDRAVAAVARSSNWDFIDSQIFGLARSMRVVALEAAGDPDAALAGAKALEAELDPGLLPGILVREALDRSSD